LKYVCTAAVCLTPLFPPSPPPVLPQVPERARKRGAATARRKQQQRQQQQQQAQAASRLAPSSSSNRSRLWLERTATAMPAAAAAGRRAAPAARAAARAAVPPRLVQTAPTLLSQGPSQVHLVGARQQQRHSSGRILLLSWPASKIFECLFLSDVLSGKDPDPPFCCAAGRQEPCSIVHIKPWAFLADACLQLFLVLCCAMVCYAVLCYAVPIASLAALGFAVQQGQGLRTPTRGEVFAALPAACCMVAGCAWVFLGTRPAAQAGLTCAFGAVLWAQQLLRLLECGGLPNVCVHCVCSRRQCLRTLCCVVLCCRLPSQARHAVPCRLPGCTCSKPVFN
jgi:hypothetical protein